ncbi:bifunctional hemolysin/adenylate cyclase-like [Antennarius striatus]|uniref:bifunctional hemolysin/adenylate cyclase-like n=1 Tax=Antennarius striatus TaxID=241820 RepID=UPI0035B057C1
MLEGGEGKDTLIGGEGNDILLGNMGDDTLYGEDGNDVMMGNSGQDIFIPGPGADLVDGGPGRDAVLYRGDPDTGKGVYVNLLTGQGRHADAEGDVLKDVEIVVGTIYSDMLVSGYESSLLKGSDGDDALVSTGGDYLVGGDGHDIYMLAFKKGSVTINNCSKDNANDILLLNSKPTLQYKFQFLADGLLLMVLGQDQTALNIELVGWTSDDSECGHLTVVSKGVEGSVGWLLSRCKEGLLL